MSGEQVLIIRPQLDHFDRCFRGVSEVADQIQLSSREAFRLSVCVSEAYTNAYLHGNQMNPDKSIKLRFVWDEKNLMVEIEDEGEMGLSQFKSIQPLAEIDEKKTGGRGIGIMMKYADKLEMEERPGGGVRVRIIFALQKPPRRYAHPQYQTED